MREIEILVEVFENKSSAFRKINSKIKFIQEKEIIDTYYHHDKITKFSPNEKNFPKEWLRIRKTKEKTILTYKKDHFNKDKWLYSDEYEVKVDDFIKLNKIIMNLGFKELIVIKNKKSVFENETYELVLEDVKDLGLFLEVESKKANKSHLIIREEIQKFINNLELKVSTELKAGKPELIIKKRRLL